MTLVLELVLAAAAILSAIGALRSAGSSKQSAKSMEKQLQAERDSRYDSLAGQTHLWKLERYVEVADAVVRLLSAFETGNHDLAKAAGEDYANAQRGLVLLIDRPVVEKALAFGNQFQRLKGFLHGAEEVCKEECELLEQLGTEYITAMVRVLYVTRSSFDAGLSEKYVNLVIENQQLMPPKT